MEEGSHRAERPPVIAVIDDEETQLLLTRSYLEDEGFIVETASNGADGLTLCRRLQPDLVLLDVEMPGMSGFELCQIMRDEPSSMNIPVAIVTGRNADTDISQGFELGVVDFLTKPITWSLLAHRVRFILNDQRRQRELTLARDAAEQASRAKSALLATMSHELQTPLNAVVGLSGMMRDEALGPLGNTEYGAFSDTIHRAGLQLSDCISDILEIAQNSPGETSNRKFEKIGLEALLTSSASALQSEAEDRNVVLSVADEAPPVEIACDLERLTDAISRIVHNAVRFNRPGGEAVVSAFVDSDGGLSIQISDDGPGCPPELAARIAEPFFKGLEAPSEQESGLGLGATVARAIFRAHGGDLAYACSENGGLIATLTLPSALVSGTSTSFPESPVAFSGAGVEPAF